MSIKRRGHAIELFPEEFLRVMRERLELTQAELANRLGIERRTLPRYEQGVFKIEHGMVTKDYELEGE